MKRCTKCRKIQPITEFYRANGKDHARTHCRTCVMTYPSQKREYKFRTRMWADHHITWDQWYDLIVEQYYKCAGNCGKPCEPDEYDFVSSLWQVDHDHKCCPGSRSCGKCVRGVLCRSCNLALGLVEDNIENLRGLIAYLEK